MRLTISTVCLKLCNIWNVWLEIGVALAIADPSHCCCGRLVMNHCRRQLRAAHLNLKSLRRPSLMRTVLTIHTTSIHP